jgi:hypothetical protein
MRVRGDKIDDPGKIRRHNHFYSCACRDGRDLFGIRSFGDLGAITMRIFEKGWWRPILVAFIISDFSGEGRKEYAPGVVLFQKNALLPTVS